VSSSTDPTRFLLAFPNGNTGAVVYFVPTATGHDNASTADNSTTGKNTTGLGATLVNGSLVSVAGADSQAGIQGELSISEDFEFGVTISESYLDIHTAGLIRQLVASGLCATM
jgi:hypothetical protein